MFSLPQYIVHNTVKVTDARNSAKKYNKNDVILCVDIDQSL